MTRPSPVHLFARLIVTKPNTEPALIAVEVTTGPEFRIGSAQRLFSDQSLLDIVWTYDVAADGRFVMIEEVFDETPPQRKPPIHITENWYEEFRDREEH